MVMRDCALSSCSCSFCFSVLFLTVLLCSPDSAQKPFQKYIIQRLQYSKFEFLSCFGFRALSRFTYSHFSRAVRSMYIVERETYSRSTCKIYSTCNAHARETSRPWSCLMTHGSMDHAP